MSLLFSKSCLYYSITWCLWEFEIVCVKDGWSLMSLCCGVLCDVMWLVWWFTHCRVVRSALAATDAVVVVVYL